jgi:hypothetical protein
MAFVECGLEFVERPRIGMDVFNRAGERNFVSAGVENRDAVSGCQQPFDDSRAGRPRSSDDEGVGHGVTACRGTRGRRTVTRHHRL